MARRQRRHPPKYASWLRTTWSRGAQALCRACCRLRCRRRHVPVEVLITDRVRRRALERELWRGLTGLERAIGTSLPVELGIVVQHVISTDRQLAGCCQFGQHPDGSRLSLIRLALQVNGRRLSTDELLGVLAEQCISVLTRESPSVLIPIELEPVHSDRRRPMPLRPDPLSPNANGSAAVDRAG